MKYKCASCGEVNPTVTEVTRAWAHTDLVYRDTRWSYDDKTVYELDDDAEVEYSVHCCGNYAYDNPDELVEVVGEVDDE